MQPAHSTLEHRSSRLGTNVAQSSAASTPRNPSRPVYELPALCQVHRTASGPSKLQSFGGSTGGSLATFRTLESQFVGLLPRLPRWHSGTGQAAAGNTEHATCGGACRRMPRSTVNVYHRPQATVRAAWPNPSFKRSANGRPPAPGRWYAVHFHRPGAGVLPPSPA